MNTIFSLDNAVLGRLDPVSATRTFRDLLWCEALRSGLSPHKAVISLRTNVSDGGIDARVDGSPIVDSILVRGTTYFQVKAGDAFKPWQPSLLKKEFFGGLKAKPSRETLAPGIRACLQSRGPYVLVTFGHDLTPATACQSERHSRRTAQCVRVQAATRRCVGTGAAMQSDRALPCPRLATPWER